MNCLLYGVILLAFPFVICTFIMIVRLLLFYFNDGKEGIEPLLKSYIWLMKHPVKMIKMGLDQTFIRFMWLNDLAFMWIAKRKYKGYRKRIKRVPYEDEAFQKDMEDTLDLCGKWVELVYDRMDAYPRYAYTPRRVVYKEYEDFWY